MLLRDLLYTTAWFGLMSMVWFGWGQEAPLARLRPLLIAGSIVGLLVAVGFGVLTALHWQDPTSLEGRYLTFGFIVGAEVGLGGVGAAILGSTGNGRWTAWWVAVVVAMHFLSLAWILHGTSLAVLGVVQVIALIGVAKQMRFGAYPTSRYVGPLMGATLLAYAVVSGVVTLLRLGRA